MRRAYSLMGMEQRVFYACFQSIQNPQSKIQHVKFRNPSIPEYVIMFLFPSIYFGKNEKVFTDFFVFFQNLAFPCMLRNEKHVLSRDIQGVVFG